MQGLRGQLLQQLVVVINTLSHMISTRRTFKCRSSGQFCYLYNLLNTNQSTQTIQVTCGHCDEYYVTSIKQLHR